MANNGFKIIDSDMRIMEPPDLWQRYMEAKYQSKAPIGVLSDNVRDLRMTQPDGSPWGSIEIRAEGNPNKPGGHNFDRNQTLYADHAARGWDTQVQLEAMDIEGLDVAVLFPTRVAVDKNW